MIKLYYSHLMAGGSKTTITSCEIINIITAITTKFSIHTSDRTAIIIDNTIVIKIIIGKETIINSQTTLIMNNRIITIIIKETAINQGTGSLILYEIIIAIPIEETTIDKRYRALIHNLNIIKIKINETQGR